jgi:hypothetical protein
MIKFGLQDIEYQEVFETVFVIAYSVWQIANLAVCVYCAIEQDVAKAFEVYLKVNEYVIGIITGILTILDIVCWVLLHCTGDYCLMIDIFCAFGLVLLLGVGLTGFMMMYEALKLSDDDTAGFAMVKSIDK